MQNVDQNQAGYLKSLVQKEYGAIATQSEKEEESSCCASTCCGDSSEESIFKADYSNLAGYAPEADLGLGCGIPTEFAQIKAGDTVVDLGSGAGNDCFVVSEITGAGGKVIGVDFTPEMLAKARKNAEKLGRKNVEFVQGDLEAIPLPEQAADVVVSNCVFNLVPNKAKAFAETFRILKRGGHFSISDIVLEGELPENILKAAEMYAGCVSGALQKSEYLQNIREAGFENIKIQKEVNTPLPGELLERYLSREQIQQFRESGAGIYSITVYAEKGA